MSVEALGWALNLAPVPLDKNGKPNSSCAAVLVGLANHADDDGTGAWPSANTLARYARISVRHVRTALDRLEAEGIITPGNPAIVAARLPVGQRPQVWDLNTRLLRDDLTDQDLRALERVYPGITERAAALKAAKQDDAGGMNTVQVSGPASPDQGRGEHSSPLNSAPGTPEHSSGLPLNTEQGTPEARSPEPSLNRPGTKNQPPPAREADDHPQLDASGEAGGGVVYLDEFFSSLGPEWPLSAADRRRLAPAVSRALLSGWSPRALAEHAGANPDGVRSPYAVLKTRLQPGQLPAPPDPGTATVTAAPAVLSAADRRQLERDQLEARMFGTVRGVPLRHADAPAGPLLKVVPEWTGDSREESAP